MKGVERVCEGSGVGVKREWRGCVNGQENNFPRNLLYAKNDGLIKSF